LTSAIIGGLEKMNKLSGKSSTFITVVIAAANFLATGLTTALGVVHIKYYTYS
jgi:hypothetical protein